MTLKNENVSHIKWAFYALALFLIYVAQTSYGIDIKIFGARPDIMPFFLAGIAVFEGPYAACIFGFAVGLFYDASYAAVEGFYPIFYMAFGVFSGIFSENYLRRTFAAMFIVGTAAFLIQNVITYYLFFSLVYSVPYNLGFKTIFSEYVLSAVFSPVSYLIIKKINSKTMQQL